MRCRLVPTKNSRAAWLVLATVLWCLPANAVDGDNASDDYPQTSSGSWYVQSYYGCENKVAGSATCTDFDFNKVGGPPNLIVFEIVSNVGCTGTTDVDIDTHPDAAGAVEQEILAGAGLVLSSTITRAVLDLSNAMVDRFLDFDLSNMIGCTDFDLLMHFWWRLR